MDWPWKDTGYMGSLGVGVGQSVGSGKEKPELQAAGLVRDKAHPEARSWGFSGIP